MTFLGIRAPEIVTLDMPSSDTAVRSRLRAALAAVLAALALAGCSASEPTLSEERRCELRSGVWRGNFCDRGGGA
jgi:hypothetical protein